MTKIILANLWQWKQQVYGICVEENNTYQNELINWKTMIEEYVRRKVVGIWMDCAVWKMIWLERGWLMRWRRETKWQKKCCADHKYNGIRAGMIDGRLEFDTTLPYDKENTLTKQWQEKQ